MVIRMIGVFARDVLLTTMFLFPLLILLVGCSGIVTYDEGNITGRVGIGSASGVLGTTFNEGELIQTGEASWYGDEFHGRRTASGEIFNQWGKTAAHRTLPLGTWLVVERVSNGRRVKVKVNDRGPFVHGRILDLSRGAAGELGMVDDGVARVRLYGTSGPRQGEKRTREGRMSEGKFTVQVGSFVEKSSAFDLKARLSGNYDYNNVHITFALGKYHRVRVGHYDSRNKAKAAASTLRSEGFETWIVRESKKD